MRIEPSVAKRELKIVLLEGIHERAVASLHGAGYANVVTRDKALAGAELIDLIADAHIVGIRSRTQLDDAVFRHAPRLIAVGCFCIGTNQVDLASAMRHGVPVFNAPFSNTRSVAELVIAEVIMLMRGIAQKNAVLHRQGWFKSASNSHEVRGKTLGIVGYGRIGTQVGVLAELLGLAVVYHDIEQRLPLGNARQVASLDELLGRSDVVTLHVPDTADTTAMIGASQLARMRPGSHLINASRGSVVDIDALAHALDLGRLHGAAIDVFPVEPEGNGQVFDSPLTRFDNVLLTPHIGGSTIEAQANIAREVIDKLIRYSDTGATASAVNFPEVSLHEHRSPSRLLHVHRNRPGVMARIDETLAAAGLNIAAQVLRTNDDVGYVVTDIDDHVGEEVLADLRAIDGTLSCRLYRNAGTPARVEHDIAPA